MAYRDFKALARRTASVKILRDKAFNIAKNPKHDEYQMVYYMVYTFFDKKSAGSGVNKHANKSTFNNEKITEGLHKPIIKKN